jgi:hypothetical protein
MLVYGEIVVNYFRGAMLVVSQIWFGLLFSGPLAWVAYSRHKVVPLPYTKVLVEVILSFITIKSKIILRVLTVLNDRMVPGV